MDGLCLATGDIIHQDCIIYDNDKWHKAFTMLSLYYTYIIRAPMSRRAKLKLLLLHQNDECIFKYTIRSQWNYHFLFVCWFKKIDFLANRLIELNCYFWLWNSRNYQIVILCTGFDHWLSKYIEVPHPKENECPAQPSCF